MLYLSPGSLPKSLRYALQSLTYAVALSILTAGFSADVTWAQSLDGLKYMLSVQGSCDEFSIGNVSYDCQGLFFSVFTNGRVAFMIPQGDGLLSLSGGDDSQPNLTDYSLVLDRVRYIKGEDFQEDTVTGKCEMRLSADAVYIHEVKCQAAKETENIVINFTGDGSPVERVGP
jgi:hypothetical protein